MSIRKNCLLVFEINQKHCTIMRHFFIKNRGEFAVRSRWDRGDNRGDHVISPRFHRDYNRGDIAVTPRWKTWSPRFHQDFTTINTAISPRFHRDLTANSPRALWNNVSMFCIQIYRLLKMTRSILLLQVYLRLCKMVNIKRISLIFWKILIFY